MSWQAGSAPPSESMRRTTPAMTVALAAILMCLPLPLAWSVMPNVALLLVIIWSSVQPRLMPVWAALVLGLGLDLLAGLPVGLNALVFAGAVVAVRLAEARIEGHSLVLDWMFATLLVGVGHLLIWQLFGFIGRPVPLAPLAVQAGLTALVYPPVAALVARLQRRLAEPED